VYGSVVERQEKGLVAVEGRDRLVLAEGGAVDVQIEVEPSHQLLVGGTRVAGIFDSSWSGASPKIAGPCPNHTLVRPLQTQLGLTLEENKGSVRCVVGDHVEKLPAGN
jgi:uncharacterized protein (TIGR03435 family)